MERLVKHGHEAFFVGGCVRDMVMGVEPEDYDIATSAAPNEVTSLFERTVAVGAAFGVVLVIVEGKGHEVATYRTERGYDDGRHPSSVSFASIYEDVKRRDFTVNGLFMDPFTGQVTDFVGGLDDIKARVIRTIGEPVERFAEDHLRMLRAVRFTASLDFSLDRRTMAAIKEEARNIRRISAERIREELTRIITARGARRGMELLRDMGLLEEILPEVAALSGVEQPREFHPEGDVWEHTLRMLAALSEISAGRADTSLAWAVLLHDVGKAVTRSADKDGVHFYGHDRRGVETAERIMRRLRFSNGETKRVLALIGNHMRFMHVQDMRPSTLKRLLTMEDFPLHLALHYLDCVGSHGNLDNYEYCRRKLSELEPTELRPPRLLTGHDLKAMGFPPGPLFTDILKALEDAQLNGVLSSADDARCFVLALWGDKREGNAGRE